jgi:acyl-CoA synthetase (NDP forming)
MPVLTVAVGRSATGKLLAGARTAKVATPLATRQALFQQAGIIAAANLGELLDTAALLAAQPVPAGNRVGVVSNTRGAAVLAADVCADAGLQVASLAAGTQRELRDLLGREALVSGPIDTTLLVIPGLFRRCLELVGADPGVDMVLTLTATTAGGDLVPEVSAARLPVPVAVAVLDQVEAVRLLPGPDEGSPPVPAYAESAARALGHAARYGTWRTTRADTYPTWTACARTGPGSWSPTFSPSHPGAAGCPMSRPWNCSAATVCRWPTVPSSPPTRQRSRRRRGSTALSHSGRTCLACCAPATPATC